MGEPEAGSEFAMRAAAAGEERRPGFGVTMRHPRGTGRVWTEGRIIPFLPSIQYPFHIHRGPEPRNPPGSKELTPRVVLLGRGIRSGGGGWTLSPGKGGRCGECPRLGDPVFPTGL